MGDAIVENTWDGEDEIDLTKNYLSDADDSVDSDRPGDGTDSSDPTAAKKRKKLASLKEKKKRLKQGGLSLDGSSSSSGGMTVEEMLLCIVHHRPPRDDSAAAGKGQEFSPLDFLDCSSPTEGGSSSLKQCCPFVRAVTDNIPSYKRLLGTSTASAGDDNGCPTLLVVCSSASRASEIIRSMSGKPLKCKVAKLFAKHFKLSEQVHSLAIEAFPVAVGTPHRLCKLIEVGALSLRLTKLVLVDMQPDSKMFNIITLSAVKHDFYNLLYSYIFPERTHLKISLING